MSAYTGEGDAHRLVAQKPDRSTDPVVDCILCGIGGWDIVFRRGLTVPAR